MKLADIKPLASQIRWGMTPQSAGYGPIAITSQADLDMYKAMLAANAGYYFYIDVWDCQARLALMHNLPEGGGMSEIVEDFKSPLLYRAVEQAGGAINISGWYPLSRRLEAVLKRKLMPRKVKSDIQSDIAQ